MSEHKDGLASQYVEKVQALGVRAQGGEDVAGEVATVVAEAYEHLRVVKTGDPQTNLSVFVAKLRLTAETAHVSQEKFKQTLLHAASICSAKIQQFVQTDAQKNRVSLSSVSRHEHEVDNFIQR